MLQRLRTELRHGSPRLLVEKSVRSVARRAAATIDRRRDLKHGTFAFAYAGGVLRRHLPRLAPAQLSPHRERLSGLTELLLQHRSDVLGLGWRRTGFDATPPGFHGHLYLDAAGAPSRTVAPANHDECQRLANLVSASYDPIDWHRDHKSGFRFPAVHASRIQAAPKPGVDIKMPWELARMQHLPTFAFAYGLGIHDASGLHAPERYVREFRDQVLDFASENPPSVGVNWACTMEVSIRAANWLVAYDLFRAFGHSFEPEFERVFVRSIYEHGRHCIRHLEYRRECRENHYLADICGLLFCAAYLPSSEETLGWLAFAIQELASEVEHQFHEDGSNIEGSTLYHALSLEMVLYTALLCRSLEPDVRRALAAGAYGRGHRRARRRLSSLGIDIEASYVFPRAFWQRLLAAVRFLSDIRRPDHALPQIGDNDSGRFLKLWPVMESLTSLEAASRYRHLTVADLEGVDRFWDERVTHRDSLCAIAECIFDCEGLASNEPVSPEVELGRMWATRIAAVEASKLPDSGGAPIVPGAPESLSEWRARLAMEPDQPVVTEFLSGGPRDLRAGLALRAYPGMGLYVFSSRRLHLVVRCGEVGQRGRGGHAHNDQLSIELVIDGRDIVRDPGTYVYTASPELRNAFRSTAAHFTPAVPGREQSDWLPGQLGLFSLSRATSGVCEHFSAQGFVGWHDGFGTRTWRVVELLDDRVRISDFGAAMELHVPTLHTNGYGRWLR